MLTLMADLDIEKVRAALKALDAYRYYVCASDRELQEAGLTRSQVLVRAYEVDPYDGVMSTEKALLGSGT